MKKKLAFLCGAGLCAGAALAQSQPNFVSVYGLVDTGVTYMNHVAGGGGVWSVHPGAMQASRLGFRGVEDLGGGLRSLFILESGVNVDTGTFAQGGAAFGRKSVVGLQTPWVEGLLGRQPDFLDDMGAMTSTIDFGSQVALIHGLDRTGTQRTNNSLRLNTTPIGPLSFSTIFGLGENANDFRAGSAWGLGANYLTGPLRVAAGYYESRAGTGTSASSADAGYGQIGAVPSAKVPGAPGDVVLRTYTVATTYQWGPARLHAAFSSYEQPLAVAGAARSINSASNDRTRILDVGVAYAVTPAAIVSASVIHDRVSFVAAGSGKLTQYNVGADYFFSKRTDVYANAGYQSSSNMNTPGLETAPGGGRSQVLTRVGIRHKF